MDKIIALFADNWAWFLEALLAVVGTASLVIKLTPTLKDDSVWLPIVKFIGKWIALDKYGPDRDGRPN